MPTGADLVVRLAKDCRNEGWDDLAESMPLIERFVSRWWEKPLMPWFTDHGVNHSRRVAEHALYMAEVPDLAESHSLSLAERYILWASAWLHDLGMQSLLGNALGDFSSADYDRVRHEHPEQSALAIRKHAADIGLPASDKALVEMIALVARSHGTAYFADTLDRFQNFPSVRNRAIRGGLLASILLMADELDLHYERETTLPMAWDVLAPVAEAHAFKHRQVLACGVTHGGGQVGFSITMIGSDAISAVDAHEVEMWITHKLRRQIALVEDAFSGGFGGWVALSRRIEVKRLAGWQLEPLKNDVPMLTIRSENARSQLINHAVALTELEGAIGRREFVAITGRLADSFVDLDGRQDLMLVACSNARLRGSVVVQADCLYETYGASTLTDVFREWIDQLAPTHDENHTASALVALLGQAEGHVLMAVSAVDLLPKNELEELITLLQREIAPVADISVVFTTDAQFAPKECDTVVGADGLLADEVAAYLSSFVPWQVASGEAKARLSYADYKRLGQTHALADSAVE